MYRLLLIACQIQLRDGQLPHKVQNRRRYQDGKYVWAASGLERGLGLSMFDSGSDIKEKVAAFEEANNYGI